MLTVNTIEFGGGSVPGTHLEGSFKTDISLPKGFVAYMVQHIVLEGVDRLVFYGLSGSKPIAYWVEEGKGQSFIDYFKSLTDSDHKYQQRVHYFNVGDAGKGSGALGNDKFAPIEISFDGVVNLEKSDEFASFIFFFRSYIRSWRVGTLTEDNFSTSIRILTPDEAVAYRKSYNVNSVFYCEIGVDDNGLNFIDKFY